jgi:hypothetical protein
MREVDNSEMRLLSVEQLRFISDTAYQAGASAEREACAKVCEDLSLSQNSEWEVGTLDCADAIRARGKP